MVAARKRAGLSQERLAEMAGLPRNTLGRIERGEHVGMIDTIELLADALRISIDEYIGRVVDISGAADGGTGEGAASVLEGKQPPGVSSLTAQAGG